MERLTRTIKVSNTSIVVYTKGKYEDTTAAEMEYEDVRNVMRRLSEYEETGLTPERIEELDERDTAKEARPISENALHVVCANCKQIIFKGYIFCPECGQRQK